MLILRRTICIITMAKPKNSHHFEIPVHQIIISTHMPNSTIYVQLSYVHVCMLYYFDWKIEQDLFTMLSITKMTKRKNRRKNCGFCRWMQRNCVYSIRKRSPCPESLIALRLRCFFFFFIGSFVNAMKYSSMQLYKTTHTHTRTHCFDFKHMRQQ